MGSNLVVVALPADDDPVWKVSSEKKPHLTLLFLGDATSNPHVDRIMLFVEHAVQIAARGPFYLEVDHRDVLGPDKADVFMFRKDWSFRWINRFRNQLLQDNDIKAAYESVEQYPEYQPHLTLGYPPTPAHEDKMPEYGITMVRFDRIAVWTSDFEGPEWRLEWPEQQMLDEVAWGVDMDLERQAAGMYALQHHGIKGMKWGVIREKALRAKAARLRAQGDSLHAKSERVRGGTRAHSLRDQAKRAHGHADSLEKQADKIASGQDVVSKTARAVTRGAAKVGRGFSIVGAVLADSAWQNSTYSDAKHEAVHNHVAKELDNHIERLQRSPKYRNKDLKADSDLRKQYYQDVAKVTNAAYRRGVKETYGENFTGTKSAHYVTDARGPRIEVRDKHTGEVDSESPLTSMHEIQRRRAAEATHAATTDFPDLVIELTIDDNGQISGVGFVKPSADAMAQSIDYGETFIGGLLENELTHYGVKGMRWGHRKAEPSAVAPHATSRVPAGDKRKTKIDVQGGQNHPAHPDAIKVAQARVKLAKSGPAALSNQELRDVATRIQLETQVKTLTRSSGHKFVRNLLGKQGNEAANQAVRQQVKKHVFN